MGLYIHIDICTAVAHDYLVLSLSVGCSIIVVLYLLGAVDSSRRSIVYRIYGVDGSSTSTGSIYQYQQSRKHT